MTIRVRLIAQTVFLQVIALILLSYGVLAVQRSLGERDVERAETQIRLAVARTATDALIQKDQVQLLSYLNFLKVQYPSLAYARTIWRSGDRAATQSLGSPAPGAKVLERRVMVSDPSSSDRSVEVFFGVDQDALRAGFRESQHRTVKVLALVGGLTALIGLGLAVLLSRSLAMSLTALSRMAEQISEGRLGVHLEWKTQDEIGALVRVFNHMSARLAELDLAKKNFVSSVTHELRSPLGAIDSFLPLIREKVVSGERGSLELAMQYMDRIEANVHRLNRFITDLLDVAKIEQGKMECVIRRIDLAPITLEISQFFEAKARAQGVVIENRIVGEAFVMADADRIRQVLVNLVSNALKFTPSGGQVWLEAVQIKDQGERRLEVTVGDTGRGMDDADLRRLFQPFSQGRNVSDGVIGNKGTGLGLYIVRSIVDQHGGKVDVQSVPDQGTKISFSLKVAA